MKTYRNPQTGHKQNVDEKDSAAITSLEAQGYVEWGDKEIEQRIKDQAKAVEEAKAKLAAAQKEVAAGHPVVKPLNPKAQVTTEADDEIASVTVETKQPSGATDVTTVPTEATEPKAPAVPKKN
jgi:sugar phosphate isomerase/epimerase